ncbi:helix-turn-helix domain-containing protein [Flavobacterium sp.]|uniref:helix-turn-helix domain-containing protein n=1 Tax=Flavobacterium sp. TaxID=239 RepID=UPI000ED571B5|nr:helix-turn-helix transcriptional regulator [Flavobacterium sp.]HCQ13873.1 XRE family transcriptional regulator [Flavobacterium sp.]
MLNTITIKEVKIEIGSVCKNKRNQFGLSREALAIALNMSSTTIQNIENGKNATLDNLLKVANHFGLLEIIYKSIKTIDTTNSNLSLY